MRHPATSDIGVPPRNPFAFFKCSSQRKISFHWPSSFCAMTARVMMVPGMLLFFDVWARRSRPKIAGFHFSPNRQRGAPSSLFQAAPAHPLAYHRARLVSQDRRERAPVPRPISFRQVSVSRRIRRPMRPQLRSEMPIANAVVSRRDLRAKPPEVVELASAKDG